MSRRRMGPLGLIAGALVCLSLTACGDDPCTTSSDCGEGRICLDSVCQDPPARDGGEPGSCVPGERRMCGSRHANGDLNEVGVCQAGVEVCAVAGIWEQCFGEVRPAPETCDGADNDCDGTVDEGVSVTCWPDQDRDGYAPEGADASVSCVCPQGTTDRDPGESSDCDDVQMDVHPGATELCDRIDSDCTSDTGVELGEDEDEDGFAPVDASCDGGFPRTDCFDLNDDVHPEQTEFFLSERGDGSFDYDCDGDGLPEITARGICGRGCTVFSGWGGETPACGMSEQFLENCRGGRVCLPGYVMRQQACR